MKILVTGATGFIGNYVIKRLLLDPSNSLICTSTNSEKAKAQSWVNKVNYIEANLHVGMADFYKFFGCPDVMIHLAWQGLPNYRSNHHIDTNLPKDCNFIKNMIANGLKKICITGTCFEYGLKEGCLSECSQTEPVTSYGIAKDTLRKYVENLKYEYDFDYHWIRLFYMYGEGQSATSILELLNKIAADGLDVFNMSGGEQLRDYLPVENVAENIVKIAMDSVFFGIVNCCSGVPISIRRLVEEHICRNDLDVKLNLGHYPYADYEPMAFWGSDSILREVLGQP